GRHLFICDEQAKSPKPDITVWNIENPDTMIKVGSIEDPDATAHNLYIVDDLAFVSYYSAGFRVYDVSDPASPVLVDEYDTSGFSGENFTGCFGVYPFTGSTLVYATDQVNGLYVFSVERDIPVPVAFTAFFARAGFGGVVLEWDVFADEAFPGFRVYRRTGSREVVISGDSPLSGLERSYVDTGVTPGTRYEYTIAAVHTDGNEILSQTVTVDVPVGMNRLFQNHPNPFNPSTTISFELAAPGRVRMDVFDTLGRRVRTIIDGVHPAGVSSVVWDGADQSGRPVVSGLYFYRLTIGNATLTRRMVLLK
ncbi:MAG: T9SS type A sorting domain-containing protein, partial [Candidatus Krumholzibacteriota bacterium]|nr:T9SS type A sorting domain-containing protein [Candidatus Krumholzibacteriota bacterium]